MGAAAHTALPWTLFSTGLCAVYAGPVGVSVFLLVPIRVGDRRLRAAGNRLSEAENLSADSWQGDVDAALPPSREDVTRRQHTGRVTFQVGLRCGLSYEAFVVGDRSVYCWPFGPVVEAVAGFWSPMLDSSLISTRRFLARPAAVLSLAICWSLPIPTR
jgi:hypothetical protein